MRMVNCFATALLLVAASNASAALITFSGLDSNPRGTPVANSYQPLLNT